MKLIIAETRPEFKDMALLLSSQGVVPEGVTLFTGSAFSLSASALVSPANSYGIMRGGFDGVIAKMIPDIEKLVQTAIRSQGSVTLQVGETLLVPCRSPNFKNVLIAPTMPHPGATCSIEIVRKVSTAIFQQNYDLPVIVMTPLGTGVGRVDLEASVREIILSYRRVILGENV